MSDQALKILKAIQDDLPVTRHPFEQFGQKLGLADVDLVEQIRSLRENGLIRRYGAVLRHRDAGFTFNAMVVFNIPDDRVLEAGQRIAQKPYISHCYERPRCADWPYNFYIMLHARNEDEGARYLEECRALLGNPDSAVLKSLKEYKKTSLQLFEDE